jgi:hypothetical protein
LTRKPVSIYFLMGDVDTRFQIIIHKFASRGMFMPITETRGKKFIQINFTGAGDSYSMSQEMIVRSVRLTAPPGKLADTDYITFKELSGGNPNIFTLSNEAKATFFHGSQSTAFGITAYSLTYPADVVISIEVD